MKSGLAAYRQVTAVVQCAGLASHVVRHAVLAAVREHVLPPLGQTPCLEEAGPAVAGQQCDRRSAHATVCRSASEAFCYAHL